MSGKQNKKKEDENAGQNHSLRKKAEEKLAKTSIPAYEFNNKSTIENIHELQVQQMELEMQTEELRSSQHALQESRDKYLDLYEFAPVGYLTLTKKGLITELNLTAAVILGVERNTVKNKGFGQFVANHNISLWEQFLVEVRRSKEKKSIELELVRKDASQFYARIESITILLQDASPLIRITVSDITELKIAEEIIQYKNYAIESSINAIAITDLSGELTDVNPAFLSTMGYQHKEEVIGLSILSFWQEQDEVKQVTQRIQVQRNWTGEMTGKRKDGTLIQVQLSVNLIRDASGTPVGLMGSFIDITDRKQVETRQYLAIEILGILNDQSTFPDSISLILNAIKRKMCFDAVGIRLRNGNDFPYYTQEGFSPDFLFKENTLIDQDENGVPCRDENGNIRLECTCGLVISGQTDPTNPLFTKGGSAWTNNSLPFLDLPSELDLRFHPRNNCIHQGYLSIAHIPIRVNNEIIGLLQLNDRRKDCFTLGMIHFFEGIATSIGIALIRRQAEENLRETTEYLQNLFEYANAPIITWDPEFHITRFNPAFEHLTGRDREEVLGMKLDLLFPIESRDSSIELIKKTLEGERWETVEIPILNIDGSIKTVLWNSANILDPKGKIISTIAQGFNITIRKQMEEALYKALKEKEVLLGEVHHRVKNNFAGVISLIDLQCGSTTNPIIIAHFKDLEVRIRSMAIVHELLYVTKDFTQIDLNTYMNELVRYLLQVYENTIQVQYKIDMGNLMMPIETIIPCGQVISEIITNSLKYAFPDTFSCKDKRGEPCSITISLQCEGNDYLLNIADNGIGMREAVDAPGSSSLGKFLIRFIVEHQLLGNLEINTKEGTAYTICFPIRVS